MKKRIFLYGLKSVSDNYAIAEYSYIYSDNVTTSGLIHEALYMKMINPSIKSVYMIDERDGLYREYMETIRRHDLSSGVVFKDTLEREGIKIL